MIFVVVVPYQQHYCFWSGQRNSGIFSRKARFEWNKVEHGWSAAADATDYLQLRSNGPSRLETAHSSPNIVQIKGRWDPTSHDTLCSVWSPPLSLKLTAGAHMDNSQTSLSIGYKPRNPMPSHIRLLNISTPPPPVEPHNARGKGEKMLQERCARVGRTCRLW